VIKVVLAALVTCIALTALPAGAQVAPTGQQAATQESAAQETENSDGQRWFNLMSKALNELNFEASFVHVQGDRIEPYRWVHGIDKQGRQYEWLMQMNGPGFRALRIDNVVSHFHPASTSYSLRSRSISTMIPTAFNQSFEQISDNYRAVAVGGARILDRKAQHIRLISKDNQRYGLSLWLDRDNGMPLKMLMVNHDGEVLEQLQLTSLTLRDVAADTIAELSRVDRPPMLEELQSQQSPLLKQQPRWAPAGFNLLKAQHHRLVLEGTPVDHYLFSDGLAEYSVYLSDQTVSSSGKAISVTGPHTLHSQPAGQLMVTVVGQIPLAVAKQVASSVQ